jgi:hypothetical protein
MTFGRHLRTYYEKAASQPYLVRFAHTPTEAEIDAECSRLYVRQLMLIEASKDLQIEAVTDYLSAKASAVEYITRGILNEASLTEFETDLKRRWKLQKLALETDKDSRDELNAGKRLFVCCLSADVLLQGSPVPADFTPGEESSGFRR